MKVKFEDKYEGKRRIQNIRANDKDKGLMSEIRRRDKDRDKM